MADWVPAALGVAGSVVVAGIAAYATIRGARAQGEAAAHRELRRLEQRLDATDVRVSRVESTEAVEVAALRISLDSLKETAQAIQRREEKDAGDVHEMYARIGNLAGRLDAMQEGRSRRGTEP